MAAKSWQSGDSEGAVVLASVVLVAPTLPDVAVSRGVTESRFGPI